MLTIRYTNGPIVRLFVLYTSLAESQQCLTDHLQPLQRYRLAQIPWILRLKTWKRFLYFVFSFLFSPFVIGYRSAVFLLQTLYAVFPSWIEWTITRVVSKPLEMSRQQLVTAGYNMSDALSSSLPPASDASGVSMPAVEMIQSTVDVSFSGSSFVASSASSLAHVADSLQQPLVLTFRRQIQALSAPAPQPRRALQLIARCWLKIRIFISQCDAAVDKWYDPLTPIINTAVLF